MQETKEIVLHFEKSLRAMETLSKSSELHESIVMASRCITSVFANSGRLLLCGNGGSAADAQHIAAEFTGRFLLNRPPLDAEALHVNTSYVTAVANDFSYDEVFARLVRAKGRKGDALVAISTSGNSSNVLAAIVAAKESGMWVIGMTGESGGKMLSLCDHIVRVPARHTPTIQELHITVGHAMCQVVEQSLFSRL